MSAPLPLLLAAVTALVTTRYGALARVSTLDGLTWQCVCVDPETCVALADHPVGQGETPERAARRLLDVLHEVSFADAVAADERAASVLAYRLLHEGPEEEPDGDGRFDADGAPVPSLADAYPAGVTYSAEEARALAAEADAEDELADLRRQEVA